MIAESCVGCCNLFPVDNAGLFDFKCSDGTVCHSDTVYFNYNNDVETVVDTNCDKICSTVDNLWITNADVDVAGDKINVTVHSSEITDTVNVTLYRVSSATGLVDGTVTLPVSVVSDGVVSVGTTWDLYNASALNIYVDKEGSQNEDKSDNFVYRVVVKDRPAAFLSINTSYPDVDSLIETYLEQYVARVPTSNQAQFVISIGRHTPEFLNSDPGFWNGDDGGIFAYGKSDYAAYAGIVGRVSYANKPTILAFGNRMEGTIASVKKLVSARSLYFGDPVNHAKAPVVVDGMDVLGLGIHSILGRFTNYSSPAFLKAATNILFDNAYDIAIKPVKTLATTSYQNNTILRLMNVNSDFSSEFKDAMTNVSRPVVLSRGIHSDLFSWKSFGQEIITDGRDVWLIEMVGGPNQDEAPNAPNYTFNDVRDYYWPALIAGVQEYSGQDTIDYVGFSFGCSAALESLEAHQSGESDIGYVFNYSNGQYYLTDLSSSPVNTFVGLGCPGNFTNVQGVMKLLYDVNNAQGTFDNLVERGKTHVTMEDVKSQMYMDNFLSIQNLAPLFIAPAVVLNYLGGTELFTGSKMSTNIYYEFMDWIDDDTKPGLASGVNLNKVAILQGRTTSWFDKMLHGTNTDIVVPNKDGQQACNNINSNNKVYGMFPGIKHFARNEVPLPDNDVVTTVIRDILKNKQLTAAATFSYNQNCGAIP